MDTIKLHSEKIHQKLKVNFSQIEYFLLINLEQLQNKYIVAEEYF